MRTDDLIDALSRDPVPTSRALGHTLRLPLALAALFALSLSLGVLGIRHDIAEAVADGWFVAKLGFVLGLAGAVFPPLGHAAQPGRRLSLWPLAAAAGVLAGLVATDILLLGSGEAAERALGNNAAKCLVSIPLLATVPLVVTLWALRDGAPTRPALAGALAGLLAGAVGAVAYGLHCSDDSPLFLSLWYVLAIGLVMAAGALAGRLLLRW